jgi:hypothetical protein
MTSDVLVMEAEQPASLPPPTCECVSQTSKWPWLRAGTRTVQSSVNPSSKSLLIAFWNLDLVLTSLKALSEVRPHLLFQARHRPS